MSLFREHYIGGLVAYSSFFAVSLGASVVGHFALDQPIDWNPTVPLNPWKIGACFVIAVLFGLWPDVDIKSKSNSFSTGSSLFSTSSSLFVDTMWSRRFLAYLPCFRSSESTVAGRTPN